MKIQFTVYSITTLITFLHNTPNEIKTVAFLALSLTVIDMLLGVCCAWVCKEFRSEKMRNKWVLKLLAYFAVVVLGTIATILTGFYALELLSFWTILLIEISSILEKLVKMRVYGGISFYGKIDTFIDAVSANFDIVAKNDPYHPGQTVMTHTSVISNNPLDPEIHLTEVETTLLSRPTVINKPTQKGD